MPVVLPHVDEPRAALLLSELAYQNHVTASSAYRALPRGPIHADLFRDNVLFDTGVDAPDPEDLFQVGTVAPVLQGMNSADLVERRPGCGQRLGAGQVPNTIQDGLHPLDPFGLPRAGVVPEAVFVLQDQCFHQASLTATSAKCTWFP